MGQGQYKYVHFNMPTFEKQNAQVRLWSVTIDIKKVI